MEKKMYDLTIDPELAKVAPPLADNELDILRTDILEHGCMTPIIIWNGVIVDGHNRYAICSENNIPFAVQEMEFKDVMDAKLWIISNQLGRRNMKEFSKCEMVLPMEEDLKKDAEKRRRALISAYRETGVTSLAPSQKTIDILAKMAGVSRGTMQKVKLIIKNADEPVKQKLRTGELKIHTAYMALQKQNESSEPIKPQPPAPSIKPQTSESSVQKTGAEPQAVRASYMDLPEPLVHMDGPIEVPPMRDKPERKPQPFPYVQDQVRFSIENMIRNLEIAMNWLRDEDQDKVETLVDMLDKGFDRAEALLRGQEV